MDALETSSKVIYFLTREELVVIVRKRFPETNYVQGTTLKCFCTCGIYEATKWMLEDVLIHESDPENLMQPTIGIV